MTRAAITCLVMGLSGLGAAEKSALSSEAASTLTATTLESGVPSEVQYESFRELVKQGPGGWEILFRAQCRIDSSGDVARKIDSLWESSGIPSDDLERFHGAQRAEIARRATNESWALLYAGAYVRTSYHARGESDQDRLDRHFSRIEKSLDVPAEALIEVAFLRVRLVEVKEFPGHCFPWSETSGKQRDALQALLAWWDQHREDFREE